VVDYPSVLGFERLVSTAVNLKLDAIDVSVSWPLDERRVSRAHDAGLKVYVWTVDDAARARELVKVGVDGITTNAPLRLRRLLSA
jgi:glycerophosphoryl diester phosphodiesterase